MWMVFVIFLPGLSACSSTWSTEQAWPARLLTTRKRRSRSSTTTTSRPSPVEAQRGEESRKARAFVGDHAERVRRDQAQGAGPASSSAGGGASAASATSSNELIADAVAEADDADADPAAALRCLRHHRVGEHGEDRAAGEHMSTKATAGTVEEPVARDGRETRRRATPAQRSTLDPRQPDAVSPDVAATASGRFERNTAASMATLTCRSSREVRPSTADSGIRRARCRRDRERRPPPPPPCAGRHPHRSIASRDPRDRAAREESDRDVQREDRRS